MKIYVASSWRNNRQPDVVKFLRNLGYDVYDFKNPKLGDNGFHWSEIDPNWQNWTPDEFRKALNHPMAKDGFKSDMSALEACDLCVLVTPCGRSAHLELGHANGRGKHTVILMEKPEEPELMYKMCDRGANPIVVSLQELKQHIQELTFQED